MERAVMVLENVRLACVAVFCGLLGVALAVGFFSFVFRAAKKAWRAFRSAFGLSAFLFVALFVYRGATKSIRWDAGLRDNGTVITNDTVAVRWTYSGIPSASSVFVDYREEGTTNEWRNLGETTASVGEWVGTLANATNYEYWVYSTYVPPVPVHTNGVWVGQAYETKARVGASAFLIINGVVEQNGKAIAPPSAKKKEDGEDEDD